jgi:putative transcriptional regulator
VLTPVGVQTQTVTLDDLGDALSQPSARAGIGVVVDADSESCDEDDLLAYLGLARAMGAVPAVSLTPGNGLADVEDVLDDLCVGLVARGDADVSRVALGLARRCDGQRARRFEYVTVAPHGAVLAILGDGTSLLLSRPVNVTDDGSEITGIELAEDAMSARLALVNGSECLLEASTVVAKTQAVAGGTNGADALTLDGPRLGARLRALRIAAGLTQAELARRTGIHRPNIARVEAGRHTPSLETLGRLTVAIGVSPTELFTTS